jgi:hypothetical protein
MVHRSKRALHIVVMAIADCGDLSHPELRGVLMMSNAALSMTALS